jgi:peroxin-2
MLMTRHEPWQDVWERTEPQLRSASTSMPSTSSVKTRVLRVGQLDAELLDKELLNLLLDPLSKSLRIVNVREYLEDAS